LDDVSMSKLTKLSIQIVRGMRDVGLSAAELSSLILISLYADFEKALESRGLGSLSYMGARTDDSGPAGRPLELDGA
jgi:hypothetical protein